MNSENLSEGERIARRRKRLGWKQEVLADKAGVGITTVVQIEKDRSVTTEKLRAVLSALDKAERKAAGPTVSTPPSTTEAPMKAGADDALARLQKAEVRLARIEVFLAETLEDVRRTRAELAHPISESERKRG